MKEEPKIKALRFHYAFSILAISLFINMGAIGFARFGYTMLLPGMKEGLKLNYAETGLLSTGNFVGYLVFALVAGVLATRISPRLVIACSVALAGLTMLLTGLASGYPAAMLARALTGVGSAGSNVPTMGLVSAWFAKKWRGTASGIIVSGSGFALLMSGWLLPRLTDDAGNGWRTGWFVLGGAVLVIAIAALIVLRNDPRDKGLSAVGVDGVHLAGTAGVPSRADWAAVYRSMPLWQLAAVYFLFGFSYITYMTFFGAYLTNEVGFKQADAGQAFMVVGLLSIVSGFIWGSVSDRLGRRYGLAIVFVLEALATVLFALPLGQTGVFLSAAIFGMAAWSVPAIAAAACGDYVGARLAPAALGFITVIFSTGQALGPAFAGVVKDATGSFQPAFFTAALAALLAAGISLVMAQPAHLMAAKEEPSLVSPSATEG